MDDARERARALWFFIPGGLLAGIFFLFVVPPFQAPDEPAHFFRAARMGRHLPPAPAGKCGAFVPTWAVAAAQPFTNELPGTPWKKTSASEIRDRFAAADTQSGSTFVPCGIPGRVTRMNYTASTYTPVPYLVSGSAVAAAMSLDRSGRHAFFAGRAANLFVSLMLVACALAVLPYGHYVVAAIALTPMSLHLMASYSADGLVIGASFLSIALFVRAWTAPDGTVTPAISLALCCAAALVLLTKPNPALVLLPLLIPLSRFRSKRRAFIHLTVAAVVLSASAIFALWSGGQAGTAPGINPAQQAHDITTHPLHYAGVLARTWTDYSPRYFNEFVGKLGWMDTLLSPLATWAFLLALFLLAASARTNLGRGGRVVLGAAFALASLSTVTAIYLTWNRVGGGIVEGVQGRYFLPFAPLLALSLGGMLEPRRWRFSLYLLSTTSMLVYAAYSVVQRYYG